MAEKETLQVGDIEVELLGMLLLNEGVAIPTVTSILQADDFFYKENQIIFHVIVTLYERDIIPNILSLIEELKSTKDKRGYSALDLVGLERVLFIGDNVYTNIDAEQYALTIKNYSLRRQLQKFFSDLSNAANDTSIDIYKTICDAESILKNFEDSIKKPAPINQHFFFDNVFSKEIERQKSYCNRSTGFANIDDKQNFSPGLYVIGATPACGKTTFCWQMLEQLADLGNENNWGNECIFCSYEMSRKEMYSKTLSRELFKRDPATTLTAADIRRGATSNALQEILKKVSKRRGVKLIELQDENIDDLLRFLKPLCVNRDRAPIVCVDYLQIIPPSNDRRLITDIMKIDDIVRKLKTFQRETNTTFIVISSFNRLNYYQQVSFESFKDSGNIEYSADVVWGLQLDVVNFIKNAKNGENISDIRKKFEDAKKQQPRLIQLKCLKNRQGNNYDCYFHYYSAHDFFKPTTDPNINSHPDAPKDNGKD